MLNRIARAGWIACGILMLLNGCATAPKADWAGRIGSWTFDDAVREMGPPDRTARLGDGSTVAEWVNDGRPSRFSFGIGGGVGFGGHGGGGSFEVGEMFGGGAAPGRRLTFSPEGILKSSQP